MISIILSTNNEMRNHYLEKIVVSLQSQNAEYELIVVDNGSDDGTVEYLQDHADLILSYPNSNRATRMNLGLQEAKGNIILFHHSATILPHNSLQSVEAAIDSGAIWGGYSHSFDTKHPLLAFTSWYSNKVRGRRGILYMDHCIFGRRGSIMKLGGFPEMDVFEETPFCERLRDIARPHILPETVITSARRFVNRGIWKHAFLNQYLKILFYLGKSDRYMNKLYEKKDGYNVKYK